MSALCWRNGLLHQLFADEVQACFSHLSEGVNQVYNEAVEMCLTIDVLSS